MKHSLFILFFAILAGCSQTPNSLSEAGLSGKPQWTDQEYRLAARILVKQIEANLPALDEAANRGDQMKGIDTALRVVKNAGEWPSSFLSESDNWRPCRLSIAYMLQYSENGSGKSFLNTNLAACKKLY